MMETVGDENEGKSSGPAVVSDNTKISDEERQRLLEKIRSRVSSAPIKEEFIDFQRFNQLYGNPGDQRPIKTLSEGSQEPPRKKQKKTGQNKNRPRPKMTLPQERLCLNVSMGKVCAYGEKCKFNHNIADMMAKKLPDIGQKCYNFDTFGHCSFGLMCRYGANHIGPDFKNITDDSRKVDPHTLTSNQLTVELKRELRKKKGNYPRSEEYLETLPRKGKGKARDAKEKSLASNRSNSSKSDHRMDSGSNLHNSGTSGGTSMNKGDGAVDSMDTLLAAEQDSNSVIQQESSSTKDLADKLSDASAPINGALPPTQIPDSSCGSSEQPAPTTVVGDISTASDLTVSTSNVSEGALDISNNVSNDPLPVIKIEEPSSSLVLLQEQPSVVCGAGVIGSTKQLSESCVLTVNGPREKRQLDIKGKLLLAPLTTVGNLPFRRICKRFGADITCGEMAMCTNLLMGQACEWALLRRHHTEDVFGVQLCGAFPDTMTKCAELLTSKLELDFIDVNVGCPIDLVYHKGAGTGLMNRMSKFEQIVRGMSSVMDLPLTVKLRTGVLENKNTAHTIIPKLYDWGASVVTVHGRSREARYTRSADWDYLRTCARVAHPHPFIGNGDILSFEDANEHLANSGASGLMVARGALVKPWIFTEIKEQRHWDISSGERLDLLKDFSNYGLEHWGSDSRGVEKTRHFLLEWLSFLHRYIPVGLLERLPQRINERPPYYIGRNDLETQMASANCEDWLKISELLLGPVPDDFVFLPKHKANSYK